LAGECNLDTEIERGLSVNDGSRETVQHATKSAGRPILADDVQQVIPSILTVVRRSAMNDDRQARRARHLHLLKKYALLHVARRVVVKVVEPDFAPGNDLGIARQSFEIVEIFLLGEGRLVWMNAHRSVKTIVLMREFNGAVERARARAVSVADGEYGCDLGCLRASNNLGAISVIPLAVKMG